MRSSTRKELLLMMDAFLDKLSVDDSIVITVEKSSSIHSVFTISAKRGESLIAEFNIKEGVNSYGSN